MSQPRQSLTSPKFCDLPPALEIQSGLFSTTQHDVIHTSFTPLHYEPGYSYPLLVWLHGSGCDERQLLRIMPLVSMRNYVAIAPRGAVIAPRGGAALHPLSLGWSHDCLDLPQAEQRIFDSIESAFRRFNIHPRRVFLAGFDAGGTMAFRVAMNHPYKFAGILSLGGCLPIGGAPLSRLSEARRLGIFLAAGRHSASYGEDRVCDDLRLLHTAGMSITLRLYPCGQELSPSMLADVDRWIIDQITAAKTSVDRATA